MVNQYRFVPKAVPAAGLRMDRHASRLRAGFPHLRVCMAAIMLKLGLSFSEVPWVESLCQRELTIPKRYDIDAALELYDLHSTGPLQKAEGETMLLELQSFCFRIADIADGILAEFTHIEVLGHSAASLPAWMTECWKSEQRKEAEAAAWPVVKRWSDIAKRERYCNGLLEEGQALLKKAETSLGLVRREQSRVPECGRLTWAQTLLKKITRS